MDNTKLKEGDILFISIPYILYRQVSKGTGSPASHVGIVFKDDKSNWIVAESAVPFVQYTTLDKFLARSDKGWYCIRRLHIDIDQDDIAKLKHEANKRLGRLYHLGFKYESNRQFCSKFVYDVFKNALGVEVGKLQTFRELFDSRPQTPLTFWTIWFFGFIPWSRVTITPASQMDTDALHTVLCKED